MSTLGEVKDRVQELFAFQAEVKALEDALDVKKKQLEDMKAKLLGALEEGGIDSYKVPGLGMIGVRNNFSVTMPKDPDERVKFISYLEGRGLKDLLTVNHQTLNAFYKEQLDQAVAEENADFAVPGLGEPKHYKTLYLRKG